MKWEDLTAPDFAKAVKKTGGVCLLAAGVVEKHFDHMPLGTDFLNGHKLCCAAAQKESAVVFPPFYFGQILEAKCFPGTITMEPVLLLKVLQAVCDEIGRNGFTKIVIHNAHGGNTHLLGYLSQSIRGTRKPYAIYVPGRLDDARKKKWDAILDTNYGGHACESETSITLHNFPELVKMKAIKGRKAPPRGYFKHFLPGVISNQWYADYPNHYAGDATPATAQKGKKLFDLQVDFLVQYIRDVKADTKLAKINKEFYDRCDQMGK